MKYRRFWIAFTIFMLMGFFLILALMSFRYNTQRFIDNPELLGITVEARQVAPVIIPKTPVPFNFDSGLDEPLVVGTPQWELEEWVGDES